MISACWMRISQYTKVKEGTLLEILGLAVFFQMNFRFIVIIMHAFQSFTELDLQTYSDNNG